MNGKRLEKCTLPIAVVGCGSAGRRIVGNLLEEGVAPELLTLLDTALVPPVSGIKPKVMPKYGDRVIGSPAGMVFVATPMQSHATVLEQISPFVRVVFLEKPSGPAEHSTRILQASEDWPVVVGYNWRFHPCADLLAQHIFDHDKSTITLHAQCFTDMTMWPGGWYGHPLYECSHEMDLAQWLLGEFKVTSAYSRGDIWNIEMRHTSGALTLLEIRSRSKKYLRRFALSAGFNWQTSNFNDVGATVPQNIARGWSPNKMYRDCVVAAVDFATRGYGANIQGLCTLPDAIRIADQCGAAIRMCEGGQ